MSRGSRFRTLLILLGTLLAANPAAAQDKPGPSPADGKASGQWTDPPAKVDPPVTNAGSKTVSTPAKLDEPRGEARVEARSSRRSAKLRRERIRTAAVRARPARQERVALVRRAERPSRRVAMRQMVWPRAARAAPMRSLRPVYGDIPPDAPADAYYEQRRFGTVGNRSRDLGVPPEGAAAYHSVGMREGGRLVMRWRGPGVPPTVVGQPSPFDAFGAD